MNRTKQHCALCDSTDLSEVLHLERVPVLCNALHTSRESALRAPGGEMTLVSCAGCGHLFNASFDPELVDYSTGYENALHYSGIFRDYADRLADHLVERGSLKRKTVVEIGCGSGEFLCLLCERGDSRGFGFDPGGDAGTVEESGRVNIARGDVRDLLRSRLSPDLVLARHVLEHLPDPLQFLATLRRCVSSEARVYLEVPDARFMMSNSAIFDVIYEHCSYFTARTMTLALAKTGFAVSNLFTGYDDQFLCVEASASSEDGIAAMVPPVDEGAADRVRYFSEEYSRIVDHWRRRIREMNEANSRIVVWGAGSKGVMFLNAVKPSGVEHIVDVSPRKQGLYIPGTAQQVVSPDELIELRSDVVILMNPVYESEVKERLSSLGSKAEIVCVVSANRVS